MPTIGKRLESAMKDAGIKTQKILSEISGVPLATVQRTIRDKTVATIPHAAALASACGVMFEWLCLGTGPKYPSGKDAVSGHDEHEITAYKIKNYEAFKLNEKDEHPIFIHRDWFLKRGLRPNQVAIMSITDESMRDGGLFEGDVVVIDLADKRLVERAVYAFSYDGTTAIHRLHRNGDKSWRLGYDNRDELRFPSKSFTSDVRVIGRVIKKISERI